MTRRAERDGTRVFGLLTFRSENDVFILERSGRLEARLRAWVIGLPVTAIGIFSFVSGMMILATSAPFDRLAWSLFGMGAGMAFVLVASFPFIPFIFRRWHAVMCIRYEASTEVLMLKYRYSRFRLSQSVHARSASIVLANAIVVTFLERGSAGIATLLRTQGAPDVLIDLHTDRAEALATVRPLVAASGIEVVDVSEKVLVRA